MSEQEDIGHYDDDNEYDLVVAYFAKNLLKEIDG